MISRRDFLLRSGTAGVSFLLSGCAAHSLPLKQNEFQEVADRGEPYLGLATSLTREYDYETIIEGKIPEDLRGTLYRNGPGLFDRGGLRKRALLDGDGMVQAFSIHANGVHFKNKFVRTQKYMEESRAGKFIYPTWSTQAPGGFLQNFWAYDRVKSQAGITVYVRNRKLYAFDESSLPYELNPDTLETVGISVLGLPEGFTTYSAHSKIDPKSGEWIHFGLEFGLNLKAHITAFDKDRKLINHQVLRMPRYVYMHDFFVSGRHILLNLHPAEIDYWGFLLGQKSIAETLTWKPERGNMVMIVEREENADPVYLDTEACYMWHSLNAHEEGDEIIADFVGYQNPDHFIGKDPVIFAVMSGRKGEYKFPGEIRRYIINTNKKTIRQEIIDRGRYEWPFVNQNHLCHKYRFGYFARCRAGEFFWSGITRFDMKTERSENYAFGEGLYCSEPVFASKPDFTYMPDSDYEPGWLMSEVYDSHSKKSFLSILDAEHLSDGPIANVHLNHHVPFSYHGFWYAHR